MYSFKTSFPKGHFVSDYIAYASERTDAAHEYHEAIALVLLSMAASDLVLRIAQFPDGLRANLYALLQGLSSLARKSTAAELGENIAVAVWPHCMMPAKATPEAFAQELAQRNLRGALWYADEFATVLKSMKKQEYMSGLESLLLQLYGRPNYTYQRVKTSVEIKDSYLCLVGCAAATVFNSLHSDDVDSGMLPRFAIIMPDDKPETAGFTLQSAHNQSAQNALVQRLHRMAPQTDALGMNDPTKARSCSISQPALDTASDFVEAFSKIYSGELFARLPVMLFKVAMLSALERSTTNVAVLPEDVLVAIPVIERWAGYADSFRKKLSESQHDRDWKMTLDWLKSLNPQSVRRRDVMRKMHFNAQRMTQVENTLEQRGHISIAMAPNATKANRYASTVWEFLDYEAPGDSDDSRENVA